MRILLVEDDPVLTDILLASLQQQRYVVDTVDDGRFGLEYAESDTYDLLLVDVGLPRLDGISLTQQLRGNGCATPILLMTAKDAPDEKIRGLDAGADDYLTKPLNIAELHARLRALLRRGEVAPASALEVGRLRLDPVSCEVSYDGSLLKLTPKEYSLLELFLRNPTRVFSRGQIIEHLWTFDDPPLEDSVKAHVKGLRHRLKKAGASGWIENVYGLGYKLSPKDDTANAQETAASTLPATERTSPSMANDDAEASVEQQFHRAMAGLWQQHRGAMADRLSHLQRAEQALQSGPIAEDLRQAAGQAAHKLAGVLGMFGRDEGTQIARDLESALSQSSIGTAESRSDAEGVSALVQQLGGILDLADQELSEKVSGSDRPSLTAPPKDQFLSPSQTQTIRLLAVDDDQVFLSSLLPMLTPWGMSVTLLSDPVQFWPVLKSTDPDLLILDIEMPGCDGIALCQAVRRDPQWQSLPILFLTGRPNAAGQVFAAGADDYVAKPVLGPELITRISNRLERTQLLKKWQGRDPQTGLVNQTQAQRDLQQLMQSDQPYAFLLLRLVNLAQINLNYGHSAGHQALRAWGDELMAQLPKALISYWGNGDFVVGLPGLDKQAAADRLAGVLKAFRQRVFEGREAGKGERGAGGRAIADLPVRFQAQYAVGLATFPEDGETLRALYQSADRSAHISKEG